MPFCEGTLYHRLGETQPDYLAAAVGVCVCGCIRLVVQ